MLDLNLVFFCEKEGKTLEQRTASQPSLTKRLKKALFGKSSQK
jgi:hypothetical protein